MKKFATIISQVFEPMVLLPLVFIFYAEHLGVSSLEILLLIVLLVGPILGYRVWMQKKQGIDWDIKDRNKRGKPFMKLIMFSVLVSLALCIFEPRHCFYCFLFGLLVFLSLQPVVRKSQDIREGTH
jgi:4-hydroxybenzoate polyprenyltransferase